VKSSLLATSASAVTAGSSMAMASKKKKKKYDFKLKYAPHFGMFKNSAGKDPLDQLKFMAERGFTALEDNGMKKKSIKLQEDIAGEMSRLGIEMGVFVAHSISWEDPLITTGDKDILEVFLKEIEESIEVAKRINAKWMTVVPGTISPKLDIGFQTANVIDALKRASEILEPHSLTMVLEPLNFYNHPNLFLTKIPQAFALCKAVGSSSCKILFDIYHQQIQEGNIIPNIDMAWDEIAYFQIGDNPGRKEPTTGEINYKNVFKHIHAKSKDFILGMEHGNSVEGAEGEEILIEAYIESDSF